MGWFKRRNGAVEDRDLTRAGTVYPLVAGYAPTDIGPDSALRIADVFACVRCLSDAAASLPLIAYRRLASGDRQRTTGRLANLLARPAPATTTANLVGTVVAHLNLHGNAFIGKYRDADGVVAQIAPLDPRTVNVELDAGQPVYTLMRPEGVGRHGPEDVIHIRALSVDGLLGMSPIAQCRQALGLANSLTAHADSFAKNGGRPSGVLRIPGWQNAQEGAAEQIRADWEDLFVGPDKSGKVLLLVGDEELQYQQLSLSFEDAEFVAQRKLSAAEIARVFRVPPWMIGAESGDSMTYSNVESQAQAFVKFALAPWLTVIEQALSADADLAPSTVFCEFLLDGLLRADAATRAQVYEKALDPAKGWMTRAEVRRLENLPEEEQQ